MKTSRSNNIAHSQWQASKRKAKLDEATRTALMLSGWVVAMVIIFKGAMPVTLKFIEGFM